MSAGNPIVTLPSSKIDVVKVTLSPAERDFYEAVHTRSKSKFDEFVAQGTALSNYTHVLELLLRLRQSCDHPFLTLKKGGAVSTRGNPATTAFKDIDELVTKFMAAGDGDGGISNAFAQEVVGQLKSLGEDNGGRPLATPRPPPPPPPTTTTTTTNNNKVVHLWSGLWGN